MEAYQELGWGPATPPSSPPLTPPSAPPPPDCAAYDAQIDIVAATSAGARTNSGFGGNNVGITVLSSDQGQARMQNDVTPGASLVRMEAGDYAMLDLVTSDDVCTIGLYQGGNKIVPRSTPTCSSDSTSYTDLRLHARVRFARNSQWPQTACPKAPRGATLPWSAPHFKPSKTLPTASHGSVRACGSEPAVGPDALASCHLLSALPSEPPSASPSPPSAPPSRRRRPPRARRRRRRARVRRRRRPRGSSVRVAPPPPPPPSQPPPPPSPPYPPPPPLSPGYTVGVFTAEASQGYEAEVPISTTDAQVLAKVQQRIEDAFPMILDDVNITVTLEEVAATGRRLQSAELDTSTCTQANVYVARMTLTTFNQQIYDDLRADLENLLSLEDSATSEGGDQVETCQPAQITSLGVSSVAPQADDNLGLILGITIPVVLLLLVGAYFGTACYCGWWPFLAGGRRRRDKKDDRRRRGRGTRVPVINL